LNQGVSIFRIGNNRLVKQVADIDHRPRLATQRRAESPGQFDDTKPTEEIGRKYLRPFKFDVTAFP